MYLSPADEERLRVFTAAELARRTIARGLRLNAPEAVALACDEMHMAARAGGSFGDVLAAGGRAVQPAELLPGVADLAEEIRLEVLLDEGSRLVVLRRPWGTGPDAPGALLEDAKRDYAAVARAIAGFEPVIMVADPSQAGEARDRCGDGIEILPVPIDD